MTTQQALRDATARWRRRQRRLAAYGQWNPWVDAEPVRRHVNAIRATGMGVHTIARHTGVTIATMDHLLYGTAPFPPASKIRPESAQALLGYWPSLDDYPDQARIDGTGTRRRLQALAAIGWTIPAVQKHVDFIGVAAIKRARTAELASARLARAVRDFYKWASAGRAEDHGEQPWIAQRCRSTAVARCWAGPLAWDNIDDPNEQPDITGHCGTNHGWHLHRAQNIPACGRCTEAHEQWLGEIRVLPHSERASAMARARAAANSRGAAIAHDGRELLRLGLDYELAAERIGVTIDQLKREMHRHPADQQGLAA